MGNHAMSTFRFYKPYQVLTQFTDAGNRQTLADFVPVKNIYPAGRLDRDSEGLLLLTDDGQLQSRISHPDFKLQKTYWVQVDGEITDEAIEKLCAGVLLKDGKTKPAIAKKMLEPTHLEPRSPPIRVRENIPTSWLNLEIKEGKNRQVRRMTAAVGFPTLRLIRYAIGPINLHDLKLGTYAAVDEQQLWDLFPRQSKQAGRAIKRERGRQVSGR